MRMVATEARSLAAASEEEAMEKGKKILGPVNAQQEDRDRLEDLGIARDGGRIAADGILVDLLNPKISIYG